MRPDHHDHRQEICRVDSFLTAIEEEDAYKEYQRPDCHDYSEHKVEGFDAVRKSPFIVLSSDARVDD